MTTETQTRKKTLYYVEQSLGCGLYAAHNLQEATAAARREIGTDNFKSCAKATPENIAWVKCMGGYVPDLS